MDETNQICSDLFDQFIDANTLKDVLSIYHQIINYLDLEPCEFNIFYPKFKRAVMTNRKNWRATALFSKIDKRAAHKCYSKENLNDNDNLSSLNFNNTLLNQYKTLTVGAGPVGMRTAIEMQLLGSITTVTEKRVSFSRYNILHLWAPIIADLKSLGAKIFFPRFCVGNLNHIAIYKLQLILLKICLMIGVHFCESVSFIDFCPSSIKQTTTSESNSDIKCDFNRVLERDQQDLKGQIENSDDVDMIVADDQDLENTFITSDSMKAHEGDLLPQQQQHQSILKKSGVQAHFQCENSILESQLHNTKWDFIIGACGSRCNTLSKFFDRKELRSCKMAIAITCNFIRQSQVETFSAEIPGLAYVYNQPLFNALAHETNIQLENICYYKDDTHYFVMTARKESLLQRRVIKKDLPERFILSHDNINRQNLLKFAKDVAFWFTGLEPLEFALNHHGQEDCSIFDFTSMYACSNSAATLKTIDGGSSLIGLVGDSLVEPAWTTGSGLNRGFLSAFDCAWLCREWGVNKCAILDYHNMSNKFEPSTNDLAALKVISERESIYRLLAQTKTENLNQNYSRWTLDPHTRYPNLNIELKISSGKDNLKYDRGGRRVKSPYRISPKKIKSGNASPSRSQQKQVTKFKTSKQDLMSARSLSIPTNRRNEIYDDLSGTLPSSNNLLSLDASRARDIEDCLRQRRQKTQKIKVVMDQLLKRNSLSEDRSIKGRFPSCLLNPRDKPLTLLKKSSSFLSFQERVKSFETKLKNESTTTTTAPSTPFIDKVKNLPEFAALNELVNNSKKSYVNQKSSLNKAFSVDKPEKQVEVFRGRIKEMTNKLKQANVNVKPNISSIDKASGGDGGVWVKHLRKELIKSVEVEKPQQLIRQQPTKQIRKLFHDDEDDGKHFDHLCINKPTNKYLSKNKYRGHLVRANNSISKVINRNPTRESKQAYLNAPTSRGSSASSTQSDYSTSTGGSTSSSGILNKSQQPEFLCFRCDELINLADKITINSISLHRNCLNCARCHITLRTNEIQNYLNLPNGTSSSCDQKEKDFICLICEKSNLRNELNKEAAERLIEAEFITKEELSSERHLREEFFSKKINYNEIYKSIIDDNIADSKMAAVKIERLIQGESSDIKCGTNNLKDKTPLMPKDTIKIAQEDQRFNLSPSPVVCTLPLNLIEGISCDVTLTLPVESENLESPSSNQMIDDNEFNRILHLDNENNDETILEQNKAKDDGSGSCSSSENGAAIRQIDSRKISKSSSINSTQNSDSTYEDFSTSEEFDLASEDEKVTRNRYNLEANNERCDQ